MPVTWTSEQVLALAPDEASRKNAGSLATPRKWLVLCHKEEDGRSVLWGEIRGSAADPYQCYVDLNGPWFKCSCPSRKQPCKHALGLFLLYVAQPGIFEVSAPPDWVTAWLIKRAAMEERRAARAAGRGPSPDSEANAPAKASANAEASAAAKSRRANERDRRIRAGLDDLETWLCDLLRQGLASALSQPRAFWETAAARLVDAQAPGLARLVRAMPELAVSSLAVSGTHALVEGSASGAAGPSGFPGWQERMIEQIARLYLAIEGYRRIDTLPELNQADLRALIGFTLKQEDLLSCAGVTDTWLVLANHSEEETGLTVQRTWLLGMSSARPALLLNFSLPGSVPSADAGLAAGSVLPAELVFYPGITPLRAVIRDRQPAQNLPATLPGSDSLVAATAGYAAALATYPWLERYPLALNGMRPLVMEGRWLLFDADDRCVPLARAFLRGWTLLALSGGHPIGVFGEWDGTSLLPLSAWAEGRFLAL